MRDVDAASADGVEAGRDAADDRARGSVARPAARAELAAAGTGSIAWQRLLDYLDNDGERLTLLLAEMLARRDQWLRHVTGGDPTALRASLERALASEIAHRLEAVAALLPAAETLELLGLARYAAAHLSLSDPAHPLAALAQRGALPDARADSLGNWRSLADWLLTKDGDFYAAITITQGFPRTGSARDAGAAVRDAQKQAMIDLLRRLAAVPGLAAALHGIRQLPPPRYDETAWGFIEALLEVLPRAAARLQLVFARGAARSTLSRPARSRCAPWASPTRRPIFCCDWTCALSTCSSTNSRTRRSRSTS